MGIERKLDARQIAEKSGMSCRPEYYSGRGATISDLNHNILERVYDGVKNNYGDEAAQQFAQMVADIPVLSATDFLLTFYTLEVRDWKWDKKFLGSQRGIYVDGQSDEAKFASAMGTILSALSAGNRNDTESIRRPFLSKHGISSPKDPYHFDAHWPY